ncbi:MAG: J domain-containing protein [Acidobacteriota bacterium]
MQNFDSEKDYYDILGIDETATSEEIEKAYRTQARKHHPDAGGSEEAMKVLNEARDLLSDNETRLAYDKSRQSNSVVYGSSFAFEVNDSLRGDAFKTENDDEGFSGSAILAATCLGIGLPLLFLVESQWVFFLWPLRIGGIGLVLFGVWMAQSALAARHRKLKKDKARHLSSRILLQQALFWAFTILIFAMLIVGLYWR